MMLLSVVLNSLNYVAITRGEQKEGLSSLRGGREESGGCEVTNANALVTALISGEVVMLWCFRVGSIVVPYVWIALTPYTKFLR